MTAADTNSPCTAKPFTAATQVGDKKMDGTGIGNMQSFLECTEVLHCQRRQEISIVVKRFCVDLPLQIPEKIQGRDSRSAL